GWSTALFPALAGAAYVGADPEMHVGPAKVDQLGDAQAELDGDEEQCVVTAPEPRATIGRSEENVGLFGREECDRASAMALVRYRQYALDVIGRSRLTSRRVSEERVD